MYMPSCLPLPVLPNVPSSPLYNYPLPPSRPPLPRLLSLTIPGVTHRSSLPYAHKVRAKPPKGEGSQPTTQPEENHHELLRLSTQCAMSLSRRRGDRMGSSRAFSYSSIGMTSAIQ